jgi:nucleotide-binding universal stress UspA family protein
MRRILLAVGDTAASLRTARQIRSWLRERETSLTLMSVVEPASLSPLSPIKRMLEHTEAIFTGAEEQPGIVVRLANDPAAELCHQIRHHEYDLLAIGLGSQHRSNSPIGTTCRAVLRASPGPMFITPPVLHVGMTPQVMFVVDHLALEMDMLHWLVAQCRAQDLHAILCTTAIERAGPVSDVLAAAGLRTQIIARPQLSTEDICYLGKDRRVRWLILPIEAGPHGLRSPEAIEDLLSKITCPVLLVPGPPPGSP